MAMERGPLMQRPRQRPSPGMDMVAYMATVVLALDMAVMAMVALATDMARGPLMLRLSLRLMPGWDMVDSTATVVLALVMVVMEVTVLAMATDSQPTVVMGMLDTAMERGLLTLSLRLMPGT